MSIDAEITALQAKITALREKQKQQQGQWPKRCTIYLHGSKESNYEQGEELGLTGEALTQFTYAAYEVELEYSVAKDGEVTLIAVDGRQLEAKHG